MAVIFWFLALGILVLSFFSPITGYQDSDAFLKVIILMGFAQLYVRLDKINK